MNKKEKKETFNDMKTLFENFYLKTTGVEYYFSAQCAGQLRQIQNKIEFSCKGSGTEPTNDIILSTFGIILKNLPEWYIDKLSISLISSHYNQIISQIKGSQQSNNYKANILKKYVNKTN